MRQIHELMQRILDTGIVSQDRTGVGTKSVFGHQSRYALSDGFPAVTTKKIPFKHVLVELLWFLRGETNTKFLEDHGVTIWRGWQDQDGNLGPVYGHQWRRWSIGGDQPGIDQIAWLVEEIQRNPDSRRLLVSAWNVGDLDKMALHPCHCLVQFYVRDGRLSCMMTQRSADVFLGVPFNVASYAILTHMLAHVTGLDVGELVHSIGDAHIYLNHIEQVQTMLAREPRSLPKLFLTPRASLFDFGVDDAWLENYTPHPKISAPVAI